MPLHSHTHRMVEERGPRWCVTGGIRSGESRALYADTAEAADRIRASFEEERYRQVQVYPPVGSVDLGALGRARRDAKEAFDKATAVLRAGVLRALEEGRSEVEVATTALVDRQTVRAWAGKQPMNRSS